MKLTFSFSFTTFNQSVVTFKVLALVVKRFSHVYLISYCKKLRQQKWYFHTFLLQIHSGNCLQKNWHARPHLD